MNSKNPNQRKEGGVAILRNVGKVVPLSVIKKKKWKMRNKATKQMIEQLRPVVQADDHAVANNHHAPEKDVAQTVVVEQLGEVNEQDSRNCKEEEENGFVESQRQGNHVLIFCWLLQNKNEKQIKTETTKELPHGQQLRSGK
jgi:hypothetical protein